MARGKSKAPARRKAGAKPTAEPAPDFTADDALIKRADEIIKNGRALWFTLLGTLVFAGVTLASVRDVAFFASSIDTKLPLLGISVPVTSFFIAGSILIAAFYAYFHLYLEQLWEALGKAEARRHGLPLADRVHPWIVVDAALRQRDRWRGITAENERCSRTRGMSVIGTLVSFALAWGFGPFVLFGFWWRSMPAHQPVMTGVIGAVLAFSLFIACMSLSGMRAALADHPAQRRWRLGLVVVVVVIAGLTVVRTWIDPWAGAARTSVISLPICQINSGETRKCLSEFQLSFDFLRPAKADLREAGRF